MSQLLEHIALGTALTPMLGFDDRDVFLDTQWERQPVVVRGGLGCVPAALLTPAAVAELCSRQAAGVSVVSHGVARPVPAGEPHSDALFGAYTDGCTILVTEVEKTSSPVAVLCRALELEFLDLGIPLAASASANAYLTPARARGFDLHYDNHCAFVIQLKGRKEWELFAPVGGGLPLARCERALTRTQVEQPVLKTILDVGDVLYIPRGFPHWASAGDATSLHLTVSLRTVTWADMACDLARDIPSLRRSLRPAADGSDAADVARKDALVADLAKWRPDDYRQRRVAKSLSNLKALSFDRFTAVDEAATIGPDTHLRRVRQMACMSTLDSDVAVLSFPGAAIELPPVMAPAFDFIARSLTFRPCDLPEVDATYDRVDLARALVSRGLLTTSADAPAQAHQPAVTPGPVAPAATPPIAVASNGAAPARDLTLLGPAGPAADRHLDWLHARQLLTAQECDAIINASLAFPLTDPTTVDEERYPGRRQVLARSIELNEDTLWFLELIRDLAAEASASHYGLSLTGITRPPQYLEYQPGRGRFERHNDYSHDQADSPRKLTVIIQLSEPADYDGGRLQVHRTESEDLPVERGSIVVFPSFLYHSVSPVTRGVRRALVCWVAGPRLR